MTITLLLYTIYIILHYAYIMAYGREMRRVIYISVIPHDLLWLQFIWIVSGIKILLLDL